MSARLDGCSAMREVDVFLRCAGAERGGAGFHQGEAREGVTSDSR